MAEKDGEKVLLTHQHSLGSMNPMCFHAASDNSWTRPSLWDQAALCSGPKTWKGLRGPGRGVLLCGQWLMDFCWQLSCSLWEQNLLSHQRFTLGNLFVRSLPVWIQIVLLCEAEQMLENVIKTEAISADYSSQWLREKLVIAKESDLCH